MKGWMVKTIVQGSSVPREFIPRMISLWKQGQFPFDRLIKTYAFEDINQAFDHSPHGVTIKPVLVF